MVSNLIRSRVPLIRILLLLFLTKIRSNRDDECSVKCGFSVFSWLRLYSSINSFILLGVRWAILQLKSPVLIMSGMSVLQALSTLSFKRSYFE